MSAAGPRESDGNLLYTAGLIGGGLVLGYGVMALPLSFGWTGGDCADQYAEGHPMGLNCDIEAVGYTGLDNLGTLPASDYSIGMIVAGFLLMVAINASMWRRTGGY